MYLGEATFSQERMNELLNVAKNLEVKGISKEVEFDGENVKDEEDDIPNHEEDTKDIELQTDADPEGNASSAKSMEIIDPSQIKRISEIKFSCDQCEKKFTKKANLIRHIQSIHEGAKYACNQCDYQASHQASLIYHNQSNHEGVKYACNQCDHQFSSQGNLNTHIRSIHEGVKYACNQCDQQYTQQGKLKIHIISKHYSLSKHSLK